MHERLERLAGVVSVDDELAREFEARLVESATLAFRVAFGVLRQREDAEDVAQEAFAKAYRSFRQLRDRERFRAWLVRMTWRLALNRRRGDRRRLVREDRAAVAEGRRTGDVEGAGDATGWTGAPAARALGSVEADLQARLDGARRAERLWAAIDALPEKLRVVTVLAAIQEHDIGEVARLLELPEGTVKSRLFLARQQLKERLSWMARDLNR